VLTDNERFLGLMDTKGWVQELDKELIPNFSNLIDAQASPPFDPERKWSLPWQSGMTGIAWKRTSRAGQSISSPHDPAQGQGDAADELADSVGLVMLASDDPAR
jgi:spermidine/putrescine transport system substrate-binding protein